MSDPEVQRDLGRLEAIAEELLDWREEMREWRRQNDETQAQILTKLNKAEGGLRVLLGVGSVAGSVGAALMAAFMKIKGAG